MRAIVVIAASAGGFAPLRCILAALPVPCRGAVFIVSHIGAHRSVLPSLLSLPGGNPVAFARDGAAIAAGQIHVAPPDHHMLLRRSHILLTRGPKVHFTRPAADPLFLSAAEMHGAAVLGVVLSGGDGDGAAGLRAIKAQGGTTLVQDPAEAANPSMPRSALLADHPDACLPIAEIARRVGIFCAR